MKNKTGFKTYLRLSILFVIFSVPLSMLNDFFDNYYFLLFLIFMPVLIYLYSLKVEKQRVVFTQQEEYEEQKIKTRLKSFGAFGIAIASALNLLLKLLLNLGIIED